MAPIKLQSHQWKNTNINVFWGEIAPCDHLVQVYENKKIFMNTLEGFAGCGLLSEDSVIIIATKEHLLRLNERLRTQGFDLDELIAADRYLPLDAEETLSKFMVNDWPDEKLFEEYISQLITRASKGNKKIRAFGEMVAVLWQRGNSGATLKLENLWCKLHSKKRISLYCAYPKNSFSHPANVAISSIYKAHTKIIDGEARPSTEIYYVSMV
jgi:hypothetical protein